MRKTPRGWIQIGESRTRGVARIPLGLKPSRDSRATSQRDSPIWIQPLGVFRYTCLKQNMSSGGNSPACLKQNMLSGGNSHACLKQNMLSIGISHACLKQNMWSSGNSPAYLRQNMSSSSNSPACLKKKHHEHG